MCEILIIAYLFTMNWARSCLEFDLRLLPTTVQLYDCISSVLRAFFVLSILTKSI